MTTTTYIQQKILKINNRKYSEASGPFLKKDKGGHGCKISKCYVGLLPGNQTS